MSGDGSISLVWGDGEHRFRLAIGEFRELQEKVNLRRLAIGAAMVGPMSLLNLLRANDAWPDDIRDILRIGLVGGGMKRDEVVRLMANHFDTTPPLENMKPAFAVLLAGLAGSPGEPLDAKKKTEPQISTSPSPSPGSTAAALQ